MIASTTIFKERYFSLTSQIPSTNLTHQHMINLFFILDFLPVSSISIILSCGTFFEVNSGFLRLFSEKLHLLINGPQMEHFLLSIHISEFPYSTNHRFLNILDPKSFQGPNIQLFHKRFSRYPPFLKILQVRNPSILQTLNHLKVCFLVLDPYKCIHCCEDGLTQ